jgi:hypothetical protein
MKILFLDIDGVLNTHKSIGQFGVDFIDRAMVILVARIVQVTGAKIVLSSTWRVDDKDRALVVRELAQHGLELHDCTPVLAIGDRCDEIAAWLSNNSHVQRFAILDDWPDAEISGSFFRTNENTGLTHEIAENVIDHLNIEQEEVPAHDGTDSREQR